MSFLERIRIANTHNPDHFRPFLIAGLPVGFITHTFADTLTHWPKVFRVTHHKVTLASNLDNPDTPLALRNEAVSQVLLELRESGLIIHWRDELYPINRSYTEPPYLLMERAAIPFFGVCGYGVHMNGFVRTYDGIKMWIGRRSLSKPTGPGKLDQLVAGGQPVGIGLKANMMKECWEEAGIPPKLAKKVIPVGAISYCLETRQGLRPDIIFNFDLELPADFTPVNTDGEVEDFYLWPIEKVMETVRDTEDFKFNCALVIMDFLIRHGFISPEHPDYMEIISGLRARETALERMTPKQ